MKEAGERLDEQIRAVAGDNMTHAPTPSAILDRRRYLRVVWFFARVFISTIWCDLILRQVPGIRNRVERTALARWQGIARRFRVLALQMGGVLIKLGQFLSIRVDVLPLEVTAELAGLQDEVPPEDPVDVQIVLAEEFGRPTDDVFSWFSLEPEAAASLAQVHKARLRDGQEVVVKVQRANIQTLVDTDLAALRVAINWLKAYRTVSRRVDLNRLFEEFAATTRAELDFVAEGSNAERFAADFADDPSIRIAKVHWDQTTRRVLTLENVAAIKIDDLTAIEAAGVSRAAVARKLYDIYLEQVFVNNFLHADPHPGNLFINPLPRPADAAADAPTPFQLVFVDFGMVAVIPAALRASLREYVIGIGLRDAHRIVQAYIDSGILLPGADHKRLEALHDVLFQSMGSVRMGQLKDAAFEQAEMVVREYRDILYEMPFQVPTDILFVGRAIGILSGIATQLDPEFDPWAATLPFAERLATGQLIGDRRSWLDQIGEVVRLVAGAPARVDRLLTQAERGDLTVQTALAPDASRAMRRLERAADRLAWAVIFAGLLLGGVLLRALEGPGGLSTSLLVGAVLALLWGATRR